MSLTPAEELAQAQQRRQARHTPRATPAPAPAAPAVQDTPAPESEPDMSTSTPAVEVALDPAAAAGAVIRRARAEPAPARRSGAPEAVAAAEPAAPAPVLDVEAFRARLVPKFAPRDSGTVTLNVRVSASLDPLLQAFLAETGASKREVVERLLVELLAPAGGEG